MDFGRPEAPRPPDEAEPPRDSAVQEVAKALRGVRSDIAGARGHLRLLQEGFNRSEAELQRARALLDLVGSSDMPKAEGSRTEQNLRRPLIKVSLLGAFHTVVDFTQVSNWNSSKARALFIYMVSHRRRRIPREQLLEALWPDGDAEAASNSLRVAVHALRSAVATVVEEASVSMRDTLLVYENGVYTFNPNLDFEIDVEEFEHHWNEGRRLETSGDSRAATREYALAESAYRGDFLQDDPYEEWSMLRREGLKDVYLAILGRLSQSCFEDGDLEGCILRCQKILETDPCREDAYQHLMRSHIQLKQPGRARRWYQVCVRVLKEELDLAPSEETQNAYRDLFLRAGD